MRNGMAVFGAVCKVLILDNLKPVVIAADPDNPRFTIGWLDYARHIEFGAAPARVKTPTDYTEYSVIPTSRRHFIIQLESVSTSSG